MPENDTRKRLLIFVVAYNAESFIRQVLSRIPAVLGERYEMEVLVIDDASQDYTFEQVLGIELSQELPFKVRVLVNPVNQGYGGNQKLGYWLAIQQDFDYVALLHGDGQYAPECLPLLIQPIESGEADVVLGSRMLSEGGALRGGMPLYKYLGNKVLTWIQNKLLSTSLSEFHSGYRAYRVSALKRIPFELNTNDFHFDTEILIQLQLSGYRFKELPIPTYYGDEICHVNGLKYALDVIATTLKARAQQLVIYYDRKYDVTSLESPTAHYQAKLGFRSPHSLALGMVQPNSNVLDLGCAGGYMSQALKQYRGCHVTGVDLYPPNPSVTLDEFIMHDLDSGLPPIDLSNYDYILVLDVIEHLKSPEKFVFELRQAAPPTIKIIASTGNVGFILTRLSLMTGGFNYGKRGILDLTHSRLFTFSSIQNLFKQANYDILEVAGTPVPFPLIFSSTRLSSILLAINNALIRLRKTMFSFQSFLVVTPRPSLSFLIDDAKKATERRTDRQEISEMDSLSADRPQ